jgi:carbon-monoxide dehydrogenase medium subunit
MRSFDYRRATSIEDAVALLQGAGEAALIAGGHTLIPAMKSRLRAPDRLVDLGGIAGLDVIARDGDRLWVGATARHAAVADSDVARGAIPSLARLAAGIGDPQVRNRGTIGGAIANNDPAADYPAACLALDAVIETDRDRYAAGDFFQGMFATALSDGEIVTRIGFRVPQAGAYAKFRHPASRYAVVGVYVARLPDGVRVAVTGAGPGAFRWSEAEAAIASRRGIDGLTPAAAGLNGDLHASADYRAHLCNVMLGRALGQMA